MTDVELAIKGDIEVMRLRPGDVIVAKVQSRLTREMADNISAALKARFPDHEIVVLPEHISLSVRRSEES